MTPRDITQNPPLSAPDNPLLYYPEVVLSPYTTSSIFERLIGADKNPAALIQPQHALPGVKTDTEHINKSMEMFFSYSYSQMVSGLTNLYLH